MRKVNMNINQEKHPYTKEIVEMLGLGFILVASLVMPGIGTATGYFMKEHNRQKWEKQHRLWAKYNLGRLRQVIRRLEKQKMVEVIEKEGQTLIGLTKK